VRIMMSLHGDAPVDAISAHLASERVNVLGFELLADEAATISEVGDAPAVIERESSAIRAVWIVDVPSRAAAVELAKGAPGDEGTLEIRESYTPEDFGAPPDPNPPAPAPPVVRKPDTHRYIAFIRSHREDMDARTAIGGAAVRPRRAIHRIEGARRWLHDRASAHARRGGRYHSPMATHSSRRPARGSEHDRSSPTRQLSGAARMLVMWKL
jgi:hypothetical protein